jgi:hypothetical protein
MIYRKVEYATNSWIPNKISQNKVLKTKYSKHLSIDQRVLDLLQRNRIHKYFCTMRQKSQNTKVSVNKPVKILKIKNVANKNELSASSSFDVERIKFQTIGKEFLP